MQSDDEYANYTDEEEDYTYEDDGEYDDEEIIPADCSKGDSKLDTSDASARRLSADGSPLQAKDLHVPSDSFTIVCCADVLPVMETLIEEVTSLLDLPRDATITLLQHFRWDKEKLINEFFANPRKIKEAAGIENFRSLSDTEKLEQKDDLNQEFFTCRICYDDQCDANDTFSLGCKHTFCRDCFSEYLRNQVQDGPTCVIACCPEHKCTERVTRDVFTQLLRPEDLERYNVYLIRNFIETCKSMRYCPAPGCDKVAMGTGVTTVRCTCSNPFCFRCGDEGHEPCSCAQLADWRAKCSNESETANWILVNTRKCPACQTRIEKNQGCNHMTCRMCKHEFCWICMGEWNKHGQGTGGYYKCNRYDPKGVGKDGTESAKAELDRYLHYYQRYHGHDHALKFASGQREAAEAKMIAHQENQNTSWIDVQFLKQAAEQVIDCRRVLKYTYVLGFYLKENSAEKQLFEHHQEMLEKNAERLHEYTEMSLDQIDRTQVVNLTRVTEKFMASLMASMADGVVILDETNTRVNMGSSSSGA